MIRGILSRFAGPCLDEDPNFFNFPTWYRYLEKETIDGRCEIVNFGIEDIPLIGLALIDIGLRIAAFVTIGYIIWGGIQFVAAQGEADRVKKARQTIINALIGLVIVIFATAIVTFVGNSIT